MKKSDDKALREAYDKGYWDGIKAEVACNWNFPEEHGLSRGITESKGTRSADRSMPDGLHTDTEGSDE